MTTRHIGTLPVLLAALGCLAGAVEARGEQEPARPLFGQTPDTLKPMSLISVSTFAGSGTSPSDAVQGDTSRSGWIHTGFNATVSHVRRGRSYTFNAGGGTSMWYYPARNEFQTVERTGRVGLDKTIGRRNRFSIAQTFVYTPFRQFGRILDSGSDIASTPLPTANPDGASSVGVPAYDLGTAVSLSHDVSSRLAVGFSYSTRWHYADESDELLTHRAGASLRFAIGQSVALVFGTATRFGASSLSSHGTTTQEFDIGIDFNRPLSFGGNVLTINTGTAMVSRSGTSDDPNELGRRMRMIGAVGLNRTLSRRWGARLAYERSIRFVEGFPDVFYADGVTGRLSGTFGRRASIAAQADYSTGKTMDVGPQAVDQFFRGIQTNVRFTSALSRWWQLFAEHNYSENHLSAGALASLAPGIIPRRYSRGVRLGLMLWSPHVH